METGGDQSRPPEKRDSSQEPGLLIAPIPSLFLALGRGTSPTTEGRMNKRKERAPLLAELLSLSEEARHLSLNESSEF